MLPVECVVRGYLTGSGLSDYRATGSICGVELPGGLVDGSRLPEPIFTPRHQGARSASMTRTSRSIRSQESWAPSSRSKVRDTSIEIYDPRRGHRPRTRHHLGGHQVRVRPGGRATHPHADEVLTPDSSRYWPADQYQPGHAQPSFDKQFVRDWLASPESGWDRAGSEPPPALPDEIVERTRGKYIEAFERVTGMPFTS
jgi:phosphoribosylaminoimidazole-succinocarboxamide synthase